MRMKLVSGTLRAPHVVPYTAPIKVPQCVGPTTAVQATDRGNRPEEVKTPPPVCKGHSQRSSPGQTRGEIGFLLHVPVLSLLTWPPCCVPSVPLVPIWESFACLSLCLGLHLFH